MKKLIVCKQKLASSNQQMCNLKPVLDQLNDNDNKNWISPKHYEKKCRISAGRLSIESLHNKCCSLKYLNVVFWFVKYMSGCLDLEL
jgi:hypothetical protein